MTAIGVQEALSLLLVLAAAVWLSRHFGILGRPARKAEGCGSGCGKCAAAKLPQTSQPELSQQPLPLKVRRFRLHRS